MTNIIYIDDDYDLYCQFCDENIPSLEWQKHSDLISHSKNRKACNAARTKKGAFCKKCPFIADNSWCRLANPGEEDLVLGKEFLSYAKEPIRSKKCGDGFGYRRREKEKPVKKIYPTTKPLSYSREVLIRPKINAAIGDIQQGYSIFNRRLW